MTNTHEIIRDLRGRGDALSCAAAEALETALRDTARIEWLITLDVVARGRTGNIAIMWTTGIVPSYMMRGLIDNEMNGANPNG